MFIGYKCRYYFLIYYYIFNFFFIYFYLLINKRKYNPFFCSKKYLPL